MLGWIQMLRTRQVPAERTQHALDVIHRNTVLQAKLIDDLLDVARVQSGKLHLERQPVQLIRVIEEAIEALQRDLSAQQLVLGRDLDPETGVVFGDPTRLGQIVVNLLSNAVKFTPPGGRIDITLRRDREHALLQVRDTGDGIDANDLPFIFERFAQARGSDARAHAGLGLGLAIVRHLVEVHGGTVTASSPGMGRGAAFIVRLPLMPEPIGVPEPASSGIPHEVPLDGIKVLVVEDDADAADLLATVLRQRRAEVIMVNSAEAALNVLAE